MIVPSWIKTGLFIFILPVSLFGQSVEAFTLSTLPFTDSVDGVSICYVDQAAPLLNKIELETRGSTPDKLSDQLNTQDLQNLSNAVTCSCQAVLMGVEKIPAVVVDQKYVVYGNTDMTGAVAEVNDAMHS